ncbi:hypothetical protein PUNSTDRAFT_118426 [Punctularia strigosozonata HHB-11173 SS5]|uniref:uncharacterized protein n=1 Tax=Punctularia strigosozonata (strain HHB-11173) TaxID=741275 RepID=UPI0004417BC2|nr:uncharacterized protein PUNSTDRAFT_118426 [Punctularia strigosozonata HHB-11173 SS5]EIN12706.1 hypothetical protein PUNSTDRAFT_118426 [Punctularia strigosozonata HHB-11173 SS5]
MGFFSSRRDDLQDESINGARVIRSRFYGRNKVKEKERVRAPTPPAVTPPIAPRPPPSSFNARAARNPQHPSPGSSRPGSEYESNEQHRMSADPITLTLAQRLSELATANAEGLLDDDEYRLLRQNLFERFASGSAAPTEEPVVRLGPTSSPSNGRYSISSSRPHPPSSMKTPRAPSIQSRTSASGSITSGVSGLLRRATGRRAASSQEHSHTDQSSVFSGASRASSLLRRTLPRALSKKSSEISLASDGSPYGTQNNSSRRTSRAETVISSEGNAAARAQSSSRRGILRTSTRGPSSMYRVSTADPHDDPAELTTYADDERLKTAKDIRAELELVEAEGRRLLDAFNGLELSTLTKKQHPPLSAKLSSGASYRDPLGSTHTLVPGRSRSPASGRRSPRGLGFNMDQDAVSTHSGKSGRTDVSSRSRLLPSRPRVVTPSSGSPLVSQPITLSRKTSLSSMSSRGKQALSKLDVPTSALGRLAMASSSTVNLGRSSGHLPLATVMEGDGTPDRRTRRAAVRPLPSIPVPGTREDPDEYAALEAEMSDIRKRRAEVTARYETRLEFLRAKLKSAEMHEKLLRK